MSQPSSPLSLPDTQRGSGDQDSLPHESTQQEFTQQDSADRAIPSSPLFFPSSSQGNQTPFPQRGASSPLRFPSSANDLRSDISREGTRRAHHRGDIHSSDIHSSPMRRRIFTEGGNTQPSSTTGLSSEASQNPDEAVRVIWGTNVSIHECADNFRNFLMAYKRDSQLVYLDQLKDMLELGTTNLDLDTRDLMELNSSKKLYHQLINYPQEVIPIMDQTVKNCLVSLVMETDSRRDALLDTIEGNVFKVRPFYIENRRGMRELNPNDIDKLVSVKGLVIRTTPIIPDMKVAFFKCNVCNHTMAIENDRGVIHEPTKCPRKACAQPNSMSIVHNRSSFADKQVIRLQETPDLVPDGQTPHSVSLCVYDELVDCVRAGDRVEVCGIFRSLPVRVNARQRALKSLYKTYLDVVHVRKIDAKRLTVDTTISDQDSPQDSQVPDQRKISAEEVEQIVETSQRSDLYEILARSVAPSIYEMDDVKKGILLQMFSGTNKQLAKGGRYRGDINILLCGDPSTSKSQLLQYVHKIAPRGVYTSGKGSSAVGLTAYITRDIDTKQPVLESGALVLSDGGICCIDEFDKMSDATRSVLHEVMEQQTISVAKAGIITTLNARTSILASANPINSRYDPNLPVTSNIDLPPPLLSRFDLVYLILDKVDEKTDRMLARHLTGMYLEDTPENSAKAEVLPVSFLTLYIQYARENCHPVITQEAKDALVSEYVAMRKLGEDVRAAERRVTATTRQLESMIRLAEAHAKMRLSERVELSDVEEGVRLIKSAIKDYATDPITGRIDMDLVQTGQSSAQRKLHEDLTNQVYQIILAAGESIRFPDLLNKINEQSQERVENHVLSESVQRLESDSKISVSGEGSRRVIRKMGVFD